MKNKILCLLWLAIIGLEAKDQIRPGIWYVHQTMPGPLAIHILEVDPTQASIELTRARTKAIGTASLEQIAKNAKAVAAINGGFSLNGGPYDGGPQGLVKIGSQWYSDSFWPYALMWSPGSRPVIASITEHMLLVIDGQRFPVHRVNQPRADTKAVPPSIMSNMKDTVLQGLSYFIQNPSVTHLGHLANAAMASNSWKSMRPRTDSSAVVYTRQMGTTTLTHGDGIEIIVDKGVVTNINQRCNNVIPRYGFVYSIQGQAGIDVSSIKIGSKATTIWQGSASKQQNQIEYMLEGAPILVHKGKIQEFDFMPAAMSQLRHARTGVGILPNGHWVLVVVDGQQPGVSLGVTLREFANLMKELGCIDALNLAGQESSQMVIDQVVVNKPLQHTVGNALVVRDYVR